MKEQLEGGGEIFTEDYIICEGLIISKCSQDPRYCDGVDHCASGADELCNKLDICDHGKMFNLTQDQDEAGEDVRDDQGNIVCKNPEDKWLIIGRDSFRFCDSIPDCKSRADEFCTFVTIRINAKSVNITREEWNDGGAFVEESNQLLCRSANDNSQWLIMDSSNCDRCNKIEDCATGIDEQVGCSAFTFPSFAYPIHCCLVVLALGVLLHLGWSAVTRADKEEVNDMNVLEAIGCNIEEALDSVVQAAVQGSPFPETSYEILHSGSGGIDLLIGIRRKR